MRSLALALLLLTTPAFAQTVEERLSRLEQEMRELRAENQELRRQLALAAPPAAAPTAAPAAPATAPAAVVKAGGREPSLTLGGYIQGQAEAGGRVDPRFSDDNDRVYLRRVRVNAAGRFAENFDFRAEWDLAGSLGNASGMRAQVTDAYVNWNRYKAANVRLGQFKTPFGYEQLFSDPRMLTPERSLGSDRITPGRQLGVMVTGSGLDDRVSYSAGAFNGNGTNASFNDDEGFLTVARVAGTLLARDRIKWTAGLNAFASEDRAISVAPELGFAGNAFSGTRDGWGADTEIAFGPAELWLELLRSSYEPVTGSPRDLDAISILGAYTLSPHWQAVARYETLDTPADELGVWTVGANYLLKGHDLKLQLHLMRGDDEDRVVARVQAVF